MSFKPNSVGVFSIAAGAFAGAAAYGALPATLWGAGTLASTTTYIGTFGGYIATGSMLAPVVPFIAGVAAAVLTAATMQYVGQALFNTFHECDDLDKFYSRTAVTGILSTAVGLSLSFGLGVSAGCAVIGSLFTAHMLSTLGNPLLSGRADDKEGKREEVMWLDYLLTFIGCEHPHVLVPVSSTSKEFKRADSKQEDLDKTWLSNETLTIAAVLESMVGGLIKIKDCVGFARGAAPSNSDS